MIRPTIRANWNKLLLLNYKIDPKVLLPYLPNYTEIALWNDNCYVSLVGFLFLDTKIGGIPIPYHRNFVEINLRFYVRRFTGEKWNYGVVFLKEIVRLPMVKFIANKFFNEHYETMPVHHIFSKNKSDLYLEYRWQKAGNWNAFRIHCHADPLPIEDHSHEHFLTSQHWGYTKLKDESMREYSVTHPKWDIYPAKQNSFEINFQKTFGDDFAFLDHQEPASVFLAEGSPIVLKKTVTLG